MAPAGPLGVLGHDLLEERRDLVLAGIAGVAHVLAVVVAGFERVVLDRDQVVGHVVEAGFAGRHISLPLLFRGPPSAGRLLSEALPPAAPDHTGRSGSRETGIESRLPAEGEVLYLVNSRADAVVRDRSGGSGEEFKMINKRVGAVALA